MRHTLKIERNYFDNLQSGIKKCEIRYNDRDYQKGDILDLSMSAAHITVSRKITHIHSGLGLKEGYVVLSLEDVK